MNVRTFFLLLVLAGIAAFAAMNWDAMTAPTSLNLGVTAVQAPLGLIMLGLLVAVTSIFLAFLVYLQTSVLLEARRHARELQSHRGLADQAEASRFTELRSFIQSELERISAQDQASRDALMIRMDKLDESTRASLRESNNTVAAYLGSLEDRLERKGTGDAHPPLPLRRDH